MLMQLIILSWSKSQNISQIFDMNMEPVTEAQASSKESVNQITYWSCWQGSMAPTTELVLNVDGCAICPECKICIHCSNVGLSNLTIHHMGSKVCCETKAKHDKDNKKKNSSILTFLKQPKAAPVPSKAMPTTMISNRQPTRGASVTSSPPTFMKGHSLDSQSANSSRNPST